MGKQSRLKLERWLERHRQSGGPRLCRLPLKLYFLIAQLVSWGFS